jgi:hypothetical protein
MRDVESFPYTSSAGRGRRGPGASSSDPVSAILRERARITLEYPSAVPEVRVRLSTRLPSTKRRALDSKWTGTGKSSPDLIQSEEQGRSEPVIRAVEERPCKDRFRSFNRPVVFSDYDCANHNGARKTVRAAVCTRASHHGLGRVELARRGNDRAGNPGRLSGNSRLTIFARFTTLPPTWASASPCEAAF